MKIKISFELDCSVCPSHDGNNKQHASEALENVFYDLAEMHRKYTVERLEILSNTEYKGYERRFLLKRNAESHALWKQIFDNLHIDGTFKNGKEFTYDAKKGVIGQGIQLVKEPK